MLSFDPNELLPKRLISRPITLWKTFNPSEDGEALQTIARSGPPTERSVIEKNVLETPFSSRWFAVYTTCRHEKRIAQHFNQREIEFYLPLYRSERKWRDGSRVTLDLPLFPGYIFVHIPKTERVRVLNVPGALAVVGGTGGEPAPLPDAAIDALRLGLIDQKVEPHALLTVGQKARIRSGAFAGMEGVVVRKKSGFRVVLTLEQIMQSIAVEVSEDNLDSVGVDTILPDRFSDVAPELCLQEAY